MNYRKEASEQVSDANILEVGKYLFSTLMSICQKGVLILS
jgi:hypothetical protein